MTEKEFLQRARAGEFVTVGEYRHSKKEMINWRDKQTGRPMTAPVLRHTVECGDNSVTVSERLPDTVQNLEQVPPVPWTKGEMVALLFEGLSKEKGLLTAQGKLERFTTSASNGTPAGEAQSPRK